jgi:hypothetical protein
MTTDKNKFKKEMEPSQHFMSKNAKIMFDLVDICRYCETEEKAIRQTNRSEAGNFVNLLNQEMEELKNSMRDKEKQCEYCKDYTLEGLPIVSNCDPLFERFSAMIADMGNGGKEIVIITKGNAFGLPINYCPICGRKLR